MMFSKLRLIAAVSLGMVLGTAISIAAASFGAPLGPAPDHLPADLGSQPRAGLEGGQTLLPALNPVDTLHTPAVSPPGGAVEPLVELTPLEALSTQGSVALLPERRILDFVPDAFLERPNKVSVTYDAGWGVGDVLVNVDTAILLRHPTTGETYWRQPVRILNIGIGEIEDLAVSMDSFIAKLERKIADRLENYPVFLIDAKVENIGADIAVSPTGAITSLPVIVNVGVELRAFGTVTDTLERALTSELQPPGTVLWSTRMRVLVEGLSFTSLAPALSATDTLLASVATQIVGTLAEVVPPSREPVLAFE